MIVMVLWGRSWECLEGKVPGAVCVCSIVTDSHDPMDCNLPGSSVHRIL